MSFSLCLFFLPLKQHWSAPRLAREPPLSRLTPSVMSASLMALNTICLQQCPISFSNLDFLPEFLAYIYNCILISPLGCLTCPTLTLDLSPKLASPSQLTPPAIQLTSKNIESSCILLFLPHLILHEKIL